MGGRIEVDSELGVGSIFRVYFTNNSNTLLNMLFTLIYVSQATSPMSDDALLKLLGVCRSWNEDHDLTGMLLYVQGETAEDQKGRFMQVLEGSEHEVKYIYDKIKADARHHHVTLLNEGPLKERNFQNWCMGFESMTTADLNNTPGYVELNNGFWGSFNSKKFNFALNFLKSFYDLRSTIC